MIDTRFTLQREEYVEAMKIAVKRFRKGLSRLAIWVIVNVCLTVGWKLTQHGISWQEFFDQSKFSLVTLVVLLLAFPLIARNAWNRQFERVKEQFTNFHLVLDEDGYTGESPGVASGHVQWPGFDNWAEGNSSSYFSETGLPTSSRSGPSPAMR